jgi:hypothetical protein
MYLVIQGISNRSLLYFTDEFAVQTCFMGRYGEEIGSDQFGATIMGSQDMNNNNNTQRVVIRMSNVEVCFQMFLLIPISLIFSFSFIMLVKHFDSIVIQSIFI